MKVFPEYFDTAQFFQAKQQRHMLKRPYLNFGKTLNIKFQDYNSNLKLQCVYWHKLTQTCMNQYGAFEYKKNIRCFVGAVFSLGSFDLFRPVCEHEHFLRVP